MVCPTITAFVEQLCQTWNLLNYLQRLWFFTSLTWALCNILHHRDTTVGFFNYTGNCWNSHFDDWLRDEIVELAAEVGVQPSFPIPDVLATHIVMEETFWHYSCSKDWNIIKWGHYQLLMHWPFLWLVTLQCIFWQGCWYNPSVHIHFLQSIKAEYTLLPVNTAGEYKLFKTL